MERKTKKDIKNRALESFSSLYVVWIVTRSVLSTRNENSAKRRRSLIKSSNEVIISSFLMIFFQFVPLSGSSYCSIGPHVRGCHYVRCCIEGKARRARHRRLVRSLDRPHRLRQRSQKVSKRDDATRGKTFMTMNFFSYQNLAGRRWHHPGLLVRRWLQPRLRIAQADGKIHSLRIIERRHRRNQELLQRRSLGEFVWKFKFMNHR